MKPISAEIYRQKLLNMFMNMDFHGHKTLRMLSKIIALKISLLFFDEKY
jgi:hypothetical protein